MAFDRIFRNKGSGDQNSLHHGKILIKKYLSFLMHFLKKLFHNFSLLQILHDGFNWIREEEASEDFCRHVWLVIFYVNLNLTHSSPHPKLEICMTYSSYSFIYFVHLHVLIRFITWSSPGIKGQVSFFHNLFDRL